MLTDAKNKADGVVEGLGRPSSVLMICLSVSMLFLAQRDAGVKLFPQPPV